MPSVVNIEPPATLGDYPPNYAQFGNKLFICRGDRRPKYLMASLINSSIKCYAAGIKPPIYYPTVAASATNANNISFDDEFYQNNVLYFTYMYYSSVRGVYSQIAPIQAFDMNIAFPLGAGIKKLTVSGFFNPRDAAATQDIDTIVVGCQYGISSGCMCLLPDMSVKVTPGSNFSSYSITFDLSPADLENGGFDLGILNSFCYIPPASKFIQRYGERVFYAGQRDTVSLANTGLKAAKALLTGTLTFTDTSTTLAGSGTLFTTELRPFDTIQVVIAGNTLRYTVASITDADTLILTAAYSGTTTAALAGTRLFRGNAWARISLTLGTGAWEGFDDNLYYLALYADGGFLGNVIDVDNTLTAYLDRDISANVSDTVDFYFVGNNSVIIPSGYTNETSGNIPASFPECAQLEDTKPLTQAVDEGQKLEGLSADGEFMYVLFNNTVVQIVGGMEINQPIAPVFRPLQGRVGTIAPRSICLDNVGRMAWIGEEGICLGDTGGVDSIAHSIGCNLFFGKSDRWMDKTTLTSNKMAYSRYMDGFVFGGFSINPKTLTGTLACTLLSGTVVGTATVFQTDLLVGQLIYIFETYYRVLTITDQTHMTITPFQSSTGSYVASIGGGAWALLSIRPQFGLWPMGGQIITSNILEYQDVNGQGVILVGDDTGVVKRLMSPNTVADCAPWTDTTYSYTASWREGFQSSPNGKISTLDKVIVNGVVFDETDDSSDIFVTLNHWHTNSPVRDEDLIAEENKITDVVLEDEFGFDVELTPAPDAKRYHALEYRLRSDLNLEVSRITELLGTTGE